MIIFCFIYVLRSIPTFVEWRLYVFQVKPLLFVSISETSFSE